MNPHQTRLVQASLDVASRAGPHLAATFYAELFAIDPSLRALFRGDMVAQGQKLTVTLARVVGNLTQPETILPLARALAVKHLEYGVEPHHYQTVATALLRALKHELGANFTAETREAWSLAYRLLADAMIEAAYSRDAQPTR